MRKQSNWPVLLSLFFLCNVLPASCKKGPFDERVRSIMQDYDCYGVSLVLVKDNRISFSKTYGYNPDYSDSTLRKPIRNDDISWIASISKTFITTAIMQLQERGLLSVDDDVNKYLEFPVRNPNYPDKPITIRMLMYHTSSLNGKKDCWNFDQLQPQLNKNYKSYYMDYAPGDDFSYCNLGYNLLAAIIEKVSGKRFDEYLDANIMKPLNLYGGYDITKLDSTRFIRTMRYSQKSKKFRKVKVTYKYNKERVDNYVLGYSVPCFWPPGGMKISATDLARFMLMHMNYGQYGDGARIISEDSERKMREYIPYGLHKYGMALAHYTNIIWGVELVGMTGGSRGIHSVMFFHPEKKYGFVVICNGCTSKSMNGIQMNREIVRAMYDCFINK